MKTTMAEAALRTSFFSLLFGETSGYVCIATSDPNAAKTSFTHKFFEWPSRFEEMQAYIEQKSRAHNVWFLVSIMEEPKFSEKGQFCRDLCLPMQYAWADLDTVDPFELEELIPTATVESSPGRWQGFWVLPNLTPPDVCEDYSRRLAYHIGADKSGWDLSQLLRVPGTINHKYANKPRVQLLDIRSSAGNYDKLEALPEPDFKPLYIDNDDFPDIGMPDEELLPDPASVMYKFSYHLHDTGFNALYNEVPHETDDWSKRMWRLINICFENGMTSEETFSICLNAKCNKFVRDGRPPSYLWREVVKAEAISKRALDEMGYIKPLIMPTLVELEDIIEDIGGNFITEYKKWAVEATDAVEEYHELCCFILLSSVVCGGLYINAKFGELPANLWGLILGDSTLTRKTTAMNMAKDILLEIDPEIVFASDGSAEGVITSLSNRPNRVSMFFKDEVSGFFDAINRKDYLAGMPELFTQLYDVPKVLPRVLRKETITITKPYFIFFGGGIKEKVHSLLDDEYVLSGFLPRFLVISGDTDLKKIRRTGPATNDSNDSRGDIMDRIKRLHTIYNERVAILIASQPAELPKRYEAKLTEEAWALYGDYEMKFLEAASNSNIAMLALPTFTRLAFSMLKMAMILAACDTDPDRENSTIEVHETHIKQAAYYVQKWGKYSIELIQNTGISATERKIELVMRAIKKRPGCTKSYIMTNHKFGSKEMNDIMQTMADRGLVNIKKEGKGTFFWPVE